MEKTAKIKSVEDGLNTSQIPALFSKDHKELCFPEIKTTDKRGNESTWQIIVYPYNTEKKEGTKFIKRMIYRSEGDKGDPILDTKYVGRIRVKNITHLGNEKAVDETEVVSGKNLGKSNATNAITQAILNANSIHNKKALKSSGNVTKFLPMLLKKVEQSKLKSEDFNNGIFVERKYDGTRVIAHRLSDGNIELYSRTGKQYIGIDHIETEVGHIVGDTEIYLDGELYIHGKNLQDISGAVRGEKNSDRKNLKYHIYDCFDPNHLDLSQQKRKALLTSLFKAVSSKLSHTELVETVLVHKQSEVDQLYKQFIDEGYEGAVLRRSNKPYEHCINNYHSSHVLKLKPFPTDEFKVVGFTEGKKGKDLGAIIFILKTDKDLEFRAVPNMELPDRKNLFKQLSADKRIFAGKYKDKLATIQYATLSKDGKPTQPKFVSMRDYE